MTHGRDACVPSLSFRRCLTLCYSHVILSILTVCWIHPLRSQLMISQWKKVSDCPFSFLLKKINIPETKEFSQSDWRNPRNHHQGHLRCTSSCFLLLILWRRSTCESIYFFRGGRSFSVHFTSGRIVAIDGCDVSRFSSSGRPARQLSPRWKFFSQLQTQRKTFQPPSLSLSSSFSSPKKSA